MKRTAQIIPFPQRHRDPDGNRWFAIHPADFAIEATHLEETEYKAMFPAVPAPIFPTGE